MRLTCAHVKPDGTRCGTSFGLRGDPPRCWFHDPEREGERLAARRKGQETATARRRASQTRTVPTGEAPPPPETLEDAVHWGSWLTWATVVGHIDSKTSREAAYALRTFLDGRRHLDKTDERVRSLQAALARLKGNGTEAGT